MLNNSGKIWNWGMWSDTVDLRLPDIDFVVRVRLQNILFRVEAEEILVDKIILGDRKLEDSVSRKPLRNSEDSYLGRSILQSPS